MKENLTRDKPSVFEDDTTFGTQEEGYKLNVPIYYSKHTAKWEVAGILLLSSEVKENIKAGLEFFRDAIPYTIPGGRFIFFMDKDFDYIHIVEEVFPGSIVLLCSVHTSRYFKDKVFTSKGFWGDVEKHDYVTGDDRRELVAQLNFVRDSPSNEIYEERERKLLEMTENLTVRPGQSVNPVSFHDYYVHNWKDCAFRWVRAFRRALPTEGTNDTQAAESTFSALKRDLKRL